MLNGDGYTIDLFPKNTSAQQVVSQLGIMKSMLFNDAARAILISFTTYCPKADIWTSNLAFYEFGVSEIVISSYVRS